MRSELVFQAVKHLENRYQLARLASKATRMLHRPNTRVADTTNEVLARLGEANPIADRRPERTSPGLKNAA